MVSHLLFYQVALIASACRRGSGALRQALAGCGGRGVATSRQSECKQALRRLFESC